MKKANNGAQNGNLYESFEWAKYRWEFMRRKPEYKKDYKKVEELREKVRLKPNQSKWEAEEIRRLSAKYELGGGGVYDPDWSFEELKLYFEQEAAYLDTYINAPVLRGFPTDDGNKIRLEIDLSMVNKIAVLKEWVGVILQRQFDKINKGKKRKNQSDLDVILKAGDMRKKGLKYQEIAQKVDPHRFAENPQSATRSMNDYCKTYDELVNGGYKDLTWP